MTISKVAAGLAIAGLAGISACSSYDSNANNGPPPRAAYTMAQPAALSPEMIQQVQSRLQQAGNYNGRIDGVWGPATESAVRGYQQQHNLNATGQLDSNTLAALNVGAPRQTMGSAQPSPANSGTPYSNATQLSPNPTR